jgi:ubiquitin-conjugating enzyme E2 Q
MTARPYAFADTSVYPTGHTCYAFAQDDDVHETVTNVLENLSSSSSKPLKDTLTRLVISLGSALGFIDDEDEEMEETQSSGDDDDFGVTEDTYGAAHIAEQTKALKRDFIEVVANSFRPGLVRFGSNDFVVITSLPLVKFPVPPTALAAWDGRLISPDMNLTLLISGFRGAYPPLNEQGHVASAFAKLKFNVGLSAGKPSREAVEAVTRDFAMKEEEIFVPDPPAPEIPEWDEDDPDTWVIPPEKPPTPEPIDPGRFERFSLSTSLNSALNDMFLPVLQLRLKYGIGWAGAELLHAEITARQITEAEALNIFSVEVVDADDEERFMKGLPPDPLNGVRQSGYLNLPLIAYSYLVRRFLVCPSSTSWGIRC